MDREKFIEAFTAAQDTLDMRAVKAVVKNYTETCTNRDVQYPRGQRNLMIATEELAELAQQTCKLMCGKPDKPALTEELADAFIAIKFIRDVADVTDAAFNKAVNVKMQRLKDTIAQNGYYK